MANGTKQCVIVVESNPLLRKTISDNLKKLKIDSIHVSDHLHMQQALKQKPVLSLINIDTDFDVWVKTISPNFTVSATDPWVVRLGYSKKLNPVDRLLHSLEFGCDNVVSQRAIEKNIALQVSRHARPVDIEDKPNVLPEGVADGIALFNQKKFHEAHDAIEPVWLKERRGIRLLYAGILQIGIAYHFIEHKAYGQALRMLGHGRAKLVHFFPLTLGIRVNDIYENATETFLFLKAAGPKGIENFAEHRYPVIQIQHT